MKGHRSTGRNELKNNRFRSNDQASIKWHHGCSIGEISIALEERR
jgi:hypothetical protein